MTASAAEGLWDEVWQVDKEAARTIHHLGGKFFCAPEKMVQV